MTVKSWEDLENRIERTLLKLEVSLDSTKNPFEVSNYVYSELDRLHKLRTKAAGLEKVRLTKKYLEVLDVYASYVLAFKDLPTLQDKEMYQTSSRDLFSRAKSEIELINRDFEESTGEAKIGFGDCLIDANLLYIKLAKEHSQRPSPEYHSIFREVVTAINQIKQRSFEFLNKLYESTNGDPALERSVSAIETELGLDKKTVNNILDYLRDKGLIEQKPLDDEKISIMPKGIREIKEALAQPDKLTGHFRPILIDTVNVINVTGDITTSQIQQASSGATQKLIISSDKKEKIIKEIESLKKAIEQYSIQQEQRSEINAEIRTIQEQLKSPKPKFKIISECGRSMRNVLEGALGSTIAAGLLAKAPTLLSIIGV